MLSKYVTSKYLHKHEIILGFREINVYENSLNFEVYIHICLPYLFSFLFFVLILTINLWLAFKQRSNYKSRKSTYCLINMYYL